VKGRVHYIVPLNDPGVNDREEVERAAAAVARTSNIPSPDAFQGKARKVAKTKILTGEPEPVRSVNELFGTLQDSDHMMGLHIGTGPNVDRVAEEKRNVRVKGYIYAFRKESDNDYHVIIGDAPGTPNPKYLNVEVSGIPADGTAENRARLWDVRKAFKGTFQLGDEGPDSYNRPDPPVPVEITGSLFWDSEHEPPHTVGPNDFKPRTAWEIHPVSGIEFLE
jgi:hypothetical protein